MLPIPNIHGAAYDLRPTTPSRIAIIREAFARRFRCLLPIVLLLLAASAANAASEARSVFDRAAANVYQILIIEAESGNKSAIGSGFQLADTDLIATNFHVISDALHKPEKYRIEFLDDRGRRGEAALLDFDVIHDLALLRRAAVLGDNAEGVGTGEPAKDAEAAVGTDGGQDLGRAESGDTATVEEQPAGLRFATAEINKGDSVYALGNPYDLGQTIIPGTYNGLLERSFYQKLLFSGSLNPGMSGGPALNEAGEIVGVNVATSGNQISFLVPAKYLLALKEQAAARTVPLVAEGYQAEIESQLYNDQEYKYALLVNLDWPTQKLGDLNVAGEVSAYFKCWGDTNDDTELLYRITESSCTSEDTIYLSGSLQTGAIDYQYGWVTSQALQPLRFHRLLTDSYSRMFTRNPAGEEDVTNYHCATEFVGADAPGAVWRTVQCVRQYKKYPKLFDVLFLGVLLGKEQRSLSSHFAISGVSRENAQLFTRKFMMMTKWAS